MKEDKNKKSGLTLIETLIYVAIFSMFIFAFSSFLNILSSSRINNQVSLEIYNQGNSAIRTMTSYIKKSKSIITPNTTTITANNLSLEMADVSKNPTDFYVDTGVLYIKEGSSLPVALTNNLVVIDNLIFNNFSNPGTKEGVSIALTLISNITNTHLISKTLDFWGSAMIRDN